MQPKAKTGVIYQCNPDVVLREEDEDGGLLYNPDTNQVKLVNTTGLFIWKQFCSPSKVENVVSAMQAEFDQAPTDVILPDVIEFLSEMLDNAFIGTLEVS